MKSEHEQEPGQEHDDEEGGAPWLDGVRAPPEPAPPEPEAVSPEAAAPARERGRRPGRGPTSGSHAGFYFYGVVRTRGWRGRENDEVLRIRYRDLEALVRPGPYRLPTLDTTHLQAHHRIVEATMRRGTVLPAPFGVVFRSRRAIVRFMEDQYLALDEGLAFLEGHWELRVHASTVGAEEATPEMVDLVVHLYAELRRTARAAIPFPRDERHLLSAAFLVERGAWIEFVNRAEDLAAAQPTLAFDVTGPWPPYDFVRMSF